MTVKTRDKINWTLEEDNRLVAAKTLGREWSEISDYLPGRTPEACIARYRYIKIATHELQPVKREPKPIILREPQLSGHLEKGAALEGSERLHKAIEQLYWREATRRKTTTDAIRLVLNYSPRELQRMAAAA